MKSLKYNVIYYPEKAGGFTAIVPALPGCVTYGKTITEAKKMIKDAILGYIVSLEKHGEEVPSADESSVIASVSVSRAVNA